MPESSTKLDVGQIQIRESYQNDLNILAEKCGVLNAPQSAANKYTELVEKRNREIKAAKGNPEAVMMQTHEEMDAMRLTISKLREELQDENKIEFADLQKQIEELKKQNKEK